MSKAIIRIKKLKTKGSISSMSSHVQRTRKTLNADPNVQNYVRFGSGNQRADYDKRMTELKIPKIRKNAVLAVDFLMTASPEFFFKNGKIDKQKTADFTKSSEKFLREKFGKNLVSATLHLDEKTPHLHALVIPEKDGRLNARHFFGGRNKLQKLQSEYHAAVKHLGLERGEMKSQATHENIQTFYGKVNKSIEQDIKEKMKIEQLQQKIQRQDEALKKMKSVLTRSQREKISNTQKHNHASVSQSQSHSGSKMR